MECGWKARVSRDSSHSGRKGAGQRPSGRISQCQGPDRHSLQVQDWKNPTGPAVRPNLAVRPFAIRSFQARVWSWLLPRVVQDTNRDGSRTAGHQWGHPWRQTIQAGPVRMAHAAEVVASCCGITGWLSWSVKRSSLVRSRAPRLWAFKAARIGWSPVLLCQFPWAAGPENGVRAFGVSWQTAQHPGGL